MKFILPALAAIAFLLGTQVFVIKQRFARSALELTTVRANHAAAHADLASTRAEIVGGETIAHQLESSTSGNAALRRKLEEIGDETAGLRAKGEYFKSRIVDIERRNEVSCGIGQAMAEREMSANKKKLIEVQADLGRKKEELAAANAEAVTIRTSLQAAQRTARGFGPR